MDMHNYRRLGVMVILSWIAMYILMYAMVNTIGNVYANLNTFYMAGLMVAPMILISLLLMGAMHQNKRLNAAIMIGAVVGGLLLFALIRRQGGISDQQFLRSMIPHHASAILMCERAPIHDAEIKDLCQAIISSQQQEIDQMKAILQRLNTGP